MQDYIAFLKYCLDESLLFPDNTKDIEWKDFLTWAEQHAIVGIIFSGIEKAGGLLSIPREELFQWIGDAQQIEMQNKLLNKKCVEVVQEYRNAGYECVVLKGQGNATMYPNPLLRTSGDIDILIKNADRKDLCKYVTKKYVTEGMRYHHIEYMDGTVPVEVHFIPCQMNNYFYHRKLMKWLNEHAVWNNMHELPDGVGDIPVPSWEYNVIFQLAHMMHHFFDEGIGLRQMIDYYYLLKSDVRGQMDDVKETLKYLNLYDFAGAVMYIMKEVLRMEEKYLIVPVDERRGKTLLNEILKGGNFGHSSGLAQNNAAKKYLQKTWRNMQLVKEYPAEAFCEPIFRTWHYFWRIIYGSKFMVKG